MCEFISWIEFDGKVLFLTTKQLKEWERASDRPAIPDKSERQGHAAIQLYYGLKDGDGIKKECTNFSTPANFPKEIVKAIKSGKMDYGESVIGLIQGPAWAKYEKITGPAWAEYEKIKGPAFWKLFSNKKNRVECWK